MKYCFNRYTGGIRITSWSKSNNIYVFICFMFYSLKQKKIMKNQSFLNHDRFWARDFPGNFNYGMVLFKVLYSHDWNFKSFLIVHKKNSTKGCFFHFCKAVYRKMMALALVPEEHVSSLFAGPGEALSENERDELSCLFTYMVIYWFNQKRSTYCS